jgi:hypothetical protein
MSSLKPYMKQSLSNIFIVISLTLCAMVFVVHTAINYSHSFVKYDCRLLMGGWHPDVPSKVIEECRKLNFKIKHNI